MTLKFKSFISFLMFTFFMFGASLFAELVVPAGTPVFLKPNFPVSSAKKSRGAGILLINKYDVKVDGKVVIKAGAKAHGNVIKARKKMICGFPGKISIEATSIAAVDGTQIPIQATFTEKGKDNFLEAFGTAILCCYLGILIPGEDAVVKMSAELNAVTMRDVSIDVNAGSSANARKDVNIVISAGMMLSVAMESGDVYEGKLFSVENNFMLLKTDRNMLKINLYNVDKIEDEHGNSALNNIMTKGDIMSKEKINWSKTRIREVK